MAAKESISPAKLNEKLQQLLNETAAAQNYELEARTTAAFDLLQRIEKGLPPEEKGLSNYYLLFNAWIRWLCDWDHYSLNLMHRRRLIGHLNQQLGIGKFTLQIYPYSSRIYRVGNLPWKPDIELHEGFDHMNDSQCRRFAQCIRSHRWKDLKTMLSEYQKESPQWKELSQYFQSVSINPAHENMTQGRVYDLEKVFSSCNQRNFGGKMPRPGVLFWSKRVNHSTMGSYNLKEDAVMINRGLDSRKVPEYVLDFIMYHELLHKALGITTVGSRRHAHTPEFRRLEKAHPCYQQAQEFLQKNASKL